MTAETAREIDEAAAAWAIRLEAHGEDPAVGAEAAAWLAADRRRRGALLRAQAALAYVDQAAPRSRGGLASADRRRLLAGGLGAAAAVGGLSLETLLRWRRLTTRVGEVRKVPLEDGSITAINTDSRLAVRLEPHLREIRLERGEAWFKVAHDRARPFVVAAGRVRVRAVGTAFSVRRWEDSAQVLVTEGVVEVWLAGAEADRVRVAAGSWAFAGPGQPAQAVAAPAVVDNALAWRDGQIALYGETLGAAAAEFNRYNRRKLVIADPQLAGEKLVGQFSTDDPEGFARAAAVTLGARLVEDRDSLRLLR